MSKEWREVKALGENSQMAAFRSPRSKGRMMNYRQPLKMYISHLFRFAQFLQMHNFAHFCSLSAQFCTTLQHFPKIFADSSCIFAREKNVYQASPANADPIAVGLQVTFLGGPNFRSNRDNNDLGKQQNSKKKPKKMFFNVHLFKITQQTHFS